MRIKDIYTGKPDAKDEINFEGEQDFIKSYVVAEHFNIESLLNGSNCFITGFKGTGKTALLFYLDDLLKKLDTSTCSSFVFFKETFTETKKIELEEVSKRIMTSISIDSNALITNQDFEYIWRWLLFKRIINDNELFSRNLFVDDEYWRDFEKTLSCIKDPLSKNKFNISSKIKMAFPDNTMQTPITPEFEIDLQNLSNECYEKFTKKIDEAESLLSKTTRTDIPYYIFVDELEAYYGEESIFIRDLCMIRDLIFTVKRFNLIFSKCDMLKTKIFCSIRSEILTAISRFIITKELNKVTVGFTMPLIWNYSNTSSYMHPIIRILLKRISICEETEDLKDIYERWFPENIHGIEPANYILNNSWCKPRDVVRLLLSTQNSIHSNNTSFSQAVFDNCIRNYSEESLVEIKEELRALYNPKQIDTIISCFMGFKTIFSANQLIERIDKYFKDTILSEKFTEVINDLYRLGFLGNFLPVSKTYRWQHKGDDRVILSDEWRLVVHYALHSSLSLGARQNYGLNRGELPQKGDVSIAIVKKIMKKSVIVEFKHYGEQYDGIIFVKEFTKLGHGFISNLRNIIKEKDEIKVVVADYSDQYNNWKLEIIPENIDFDNSK